MKAKIHEAAKTAVKKAFIEMDMDIMLKPKSTTYLALSQNSHPDTYLHIHPRCTDPLTNPYIDCHASSSLCLCKDSQANDIVGEEIRTAYHRLYRGCIPLLDEPDALRKTKEMAWDCITRAGPKAKEDVTERGDEHNLCCKSETSHLKKWMQWHVGWACDQAERQF